MIKLIRLKMAKTKSSAPLFQNSTLIVEKDLRKNNRRFLPNGCHFVISYLGEEIQKNWSIVEQFNTSAQSANVEQIGLTNNPATSMTH